MAALLAGCGGATVTDAGVTDAELDAVDAGPPRCDAVSDGRLVLPGDDNGIFDPSVATDPASGRVWMSYSSVDGPGGSGRISTWLAYSDDGGQRWCGARRVNAARDVPTAERPAALAAFPTHWSHEVSALVYDVDAPAA